MTILESLPHVADVYRRSWTNDSYAAAVPAETKVQSSLACWVQSASASAISRYQSSDQNVTHQILLNADPGLRLGDIVIPTTGTFANRRLTITAFAERTSGLGWMWVLYCGADGEDAPTSFAG